MEVKGEWMGFAAMMKYIRIKERTKAVSTATAEREESRIRNIPDIPPLLLCINIEKKETTAGESGKQGTLRTC